MGRYGHFLELALFLAPGCRIGLNFLELHNKNVKLICDIFLKWYYDQKIISFFSSDFESVFAKHPTGKILSFVFYPKAVYFECKFGISRSAITHVQN